MAKTFGRQHAENMKKIKAEVKAIRKDPRKDRGGKKACPSCNGTVKLVPTIFRTERRQASGGCPRCGGDGWI